MKAEPGGSSLGIRNTAAVLFGLVMVLSSMAILVPVKTQAAEPSQVVLPPVKMSGNQIPETYNPLNMGLTIEYLAVYNIYDVLLIQDEDLTTTYLPALAKSWYVKADKMTWIFNITNKANWSDGTPLTARDVSWTFNWFTNASYGASTPGWEDYFVNITSIRYTSLYQVEIVTEFAMPRSMVESIFTGMLVLPQHIWENIKGQPKNYKATPVGSGPFLFLAEIPNGFKLKKNPDYWGPREYGPTWKVQVDEVWYQGSTDETAMVTDFINGNWDLLLDPSAAAFEDPDLQSYVVANPTKAYLQETASGFTATYTANVKPQVSGPWNTDPLLYNQTIRTALAMSVDKARLIQDGLLGHGVLGDTLIPPTNPWHLDIPANMEIPFDTAAARQMLRDANYTFQVDGITPAGPTYYPLTNSTGDTLEFDFSAPNSHPEFDPMMNLIIGWAREAGINLKKDYPTESVMVNRWFVGDWEIWLWDWDFFPTGDPSTGYLILETCEGSVPPSGDNYYCDPEFDRLYQLSIRELNDTKRRQYTDQMQWMIYNYSSYIIPYYGQRLYAIRTDSWTNWGDWEAHYGLPPDLGGVPWLWFRLQRAGNVAPTVVSPITPVTSFMNTQVSFQTVVTDADGDALTYNWTWGDTNPTVTGTWWMNHTYANEGNYTVTVLVNDGHGHDVTETTWALILDPLQDPPTGLDFVVSPSYPYAAPSSVQFTSIATDADGDTLYFTWDFGDGTPLQYAGTAFVVTHSFTAAGNYVVTMYADDRHLGPGHNASVSKVVTIHVNEPPTVSALPNVQVLPNVARSYLATATDPDPADVLQYTWNFGDTTPLVVGNPVTHTYTTEGTYTYRVYVDDQTGLPGHNVSAQGLVSVSTAFEPGPENLTITPSTWTPVVGSPVTFTGDADDPNGDPLRYTWDFGDTSPLVVGKTVTHTYTAPGLVTVTMHVSDGDAKDPLYHNVSTTITFSVTTNAPPIVAAAADYSAQPGVPLTLSISAVDTEPLRYTWKFGDGSANESGVGSAYASRTHTYTTAGTYTYTVWVDDESGLAGHNISRSGTVTVGGLNLPPNVPGIVTSIDQQNRRVEVNVQVTFSSAASDPDGDPLTYTWNWGDGSAPETGSGASYAVRTHTFTAVGQFNVNVTVTDGIAGHERTSPIAVITVVEAPSEGIGMLAIAGIIGIIIVAAAIAGVLLMRRRKKEPGPGEPGAPL